jgi:hypothetical protein
VVTLELQDDEVGSRRIPTTQPVASCGAADREITFPLGPNKGHTKNYLNHFGSARFCSADIAAQLKPVLEPHLAKDVML